MTIGSGKPGRHPPTVASAAPRSRRGRRLDEPASARCHRLSPGGEPRPSGTARPRTFAVHGRSALSSGGESQDTRTARLTGHHHDCDAGHLLADIAGIVTPDTILRWYRRL